MKKISFICVSIFILSSCATMFNGTTQNINIMTSNGDTVKADITSINGMQSVTLPTVVSVSKGNTPLTISVKEDDCHRQTITMSDNHLDMFFLGNYFNLWTGTTTDISNGAMWKYDNNIIVPIYRKDTCPVK